jgi:hypothetical protein
MMSQQRIYPKMGNPKKGCGQTGVQNTPLAAAAETLPLGFGRQDTHHQVFYRLVDFSHAV